ncbi:MAG: FadR family transcriptional regulator [Oscillospiraceae bacterium]|nr:FadR family transcriptional regulator [Oscillospiraceae bacterium]
MSFEKLSVRSVREEFVRAIENKILSGELSIGDRLPPARELCDLMGVSLTTVSTGITELANKGFLEVKPRHGVYVKDYRKDATPETFFAILRYNGGNLNAHEIRSFTETRIAADPLVARLVAERASEEELAELVALSTQFSACKEIPAACESITALCHRMYQLSDNSIFAMMYKTTMEAQKGMYALYFRKNGLQQAKKIMSEVVDALYVRDWELAGRLLLSSMEGVISGPTSLLS